ncbi:MAG: hypothetical protein ACYSW3_30315 [Planctomycetota bacterium]|jgi:hypothetical protein
MAKRVHGQLFKADNKVPGTHVMWIERPLDETPEDFEKLATSGGRGRVDVAVDVRLGDLINFSGNAYGALTNHLEELILGDMTEQDWHLIPSYIAPIGGEPESETEYIGGTVIFRVKGKLEQN